MQFTWKTTLMSADHAEMIKPIEDVTRKLYLGNVSKSHHLPKKAVMGERAL